MVDALGSLTAPSPLAVVLVALAGAPITAVLGWRRPGLAGVLAVAAALATLALIVATWFAGGSSVSLPWVPIWGLRIGLTFDGLSAIYGLLATGIGAVVLAYSCAYIPRHLAHQDRDPNEATTFYALILLFMGAMVGLVMADDLFLLFLFWDLTAVVSYFLIGFDRDEPLSRPAALMALLVTGGTAIFMLAGIVVLWLVSGTTSITTLVEVAPDSPAFSVAVGLVVIAALAKSAQMPLHFWLPRAMVAPTPVSSYLHSAAMVAAGVFLLERIFPLVHQAAWVPEILVAVGLASIGLGGLLALSRDDLKRILAYSTIGQYGYVVVLIGLGGTYGAIGAAMYVIAHAAAKCALFLTAGAVAEATGRRSLSEVGGLGRQMPLLAAASGVATAAIAALPVTLGFFKDELFFAAMHREGAAFTVAAVLSAGMTFAYIGRFWIGIFLGASDAEARPVPAVMTGAVMILAALCLIGGVWIGPANALADAGGSASLFERVSIGLAYHLDTRPENLMALSAYGLGIVFLGALPVLGALSEWVAVFSARLGPDRAYRWVIESLNAFSDRIHGYEIHDLRTRVASVLLPVGILVLLGLVVTPNENAYLVGTLAADDLLIVLMLAVACGAALTTARTQGHLAAAIVLSAVGFSLATVYAFLGAPDVALVAVLMETMISVLFIGFLAAMRDRPRVEGVERDPAESHPGRDRVLAIIAGGAAFVIVWGVLSKPAATDPTAKIQIALTPTAHARDVVTAILSDFRGMDTMGEITVIGIAMIGLLTLLQRPIQRRSRP